MEQQSSVEPRHSASEVGNHYSCQKLVRRWIDHPDMPSNQAIRILHGSLMSGISEYQKKGVLPIDPDAYRMTDLRVSQAPLNFFVRGLDVAPTMRSYTQELDTIIKGEHVSPETKLAQTVHDAAWAYFTFIRIHPFLDGNGRVGRMILKRVMMGRGYKDIIFQSSGADGKGREAHLDAMDAVDHSGNLAHLELYLLDQLRMRYLDNDSGVLLQEIDGLAEAKQGEIQKQNERKDISEIWRGFKELDLDGVATPEYHTVA